MSPESPGKKEAELGLSVATSGQTGTITTDLNVCTLAQCGTNPS